MPRRLVRRKEAPEMTKGTLLDTCPHGGEKRLGVIPIFYSFNPWSDSTLDVGSVVTSLGEFTGYLGRTFLKCLSARGVCYIRVRNLQRHRPGESVDESKVIEKPRRLSSRKSSVKKTEPEE